MGIEYGEQFYLCTWQPPDPSVGERRGMWICHHAETGEYDASASEYATEHYDV